MIRWIFSFVDRFGSYYADILEFVYWYSIRLFSKDRFCCNRIIFCCNLIRCIFYSEIRKIFLCSICIRDLAIQFIGIKSISFIHISIRIIPLDFSHRDRFYRDFCRKTIRLDGYGLFGTVDFFRSNLKICNCLFPAKQTYRMYRKIFFYYTRILIWLSTGIGCFDLIWDEPGSNKDDSTDSHSNE